MILHHYELSPFSEKIRSMLGYSGLSWQSAISPPMPPRPTVDPLAGGYRRIPVAQIGADIFCDTRIISTEIAAIAGKPELALENCSKDIQEFVQHADTEVFFAVVRSGSPAKAISFILKHFSPWQAFKFIKDRAGVQRDASIAPMSRNRAIEILAEHLLDLEQRFGSTEFCFGDTPTIADFSAFHLLWFRNKTEGDELLENIPDIRDWYHRMLDMGHGDRREISRQQAFAAALEHAPRAVPEVMKRDPLIGKKVQVRPSDYARDAVTGTLAGVDQQRIIVARETSKFGTLHVHFPRTDFELSQTG